MRQLFYFARILGRLEMKIIDTEKLVQTILENNPETRKDDITLILAVWEKCGIKFSQSIKNKLRRACHPETITRARRKVQERLPHLIDWQTHKEREEKQEQFKEMFR